MDLNKLILTAALCGLPVAHALCAGSGYTQNVFPDGALDAGEQCDDGNLIPGDGCNQFCEIENLVFVSVDDELAIQCFHPADTGALVADITRDSALGTTGSPTTRAMAVPRGFTNLVFGRTLETMQVKGQGAEGNDFLLSSQPTGGVFQQGDEPLERVGTVFSQDHGYETLDPFGDRCYLVDYMQAQSTYLDGVDVAAMTANNQATLRAQVRSRFYPGEEFPDIVWHPHYDDTGAAIAQDAGNEQFYSVQNCRSHLLDWRPKSVTTQFPVVNKRDATAVYPASQSHERLLHHFHDAYLTERCPRTPALDQRYQPESEAQLPEWTASYTQTPPLRHHGFGESYRAFLAADRTPSTLADAGTALGGSGEPVDARLFQPTSQSVGFWEGCAVWTTPGVDTFLTFDVSGMFVDSDSSRWATMFLMWDDPDDAADNCPAMIDITLQNSPDRNLIPSNEGTINAFDNVASTTLATGSVSARKYPICGDGFVDWPFESCEPDAGDQTAILAAFPNYQDTNSANIPVGASCTAWCTQEVAAGTEVCGNGIVEGNEVCDAGEAGFDGYPHHDWALVWNGVGTFEDPSTWRNAGCDAASPVGNAACLAADPIVYSAVLGCSGSQGGDAETQCMPQYAWAPGPDVANTAGGVKGATRFTGSRITNLQTKAGTASGSTTANIRGDGSRHLRAVQRFEWRVPGFAPLNSDLFSPWRHPIHRIMMDPEVSQVQGAGFAPATPFSDGDSVLLAGALAGVKVRAGIADDSVELTDCPALTDGITVTLFPGDVYGANPMYGTDIVYNLNTLYYGSFAECGDFPQGPTLGFGAAPARPGLRAEADLFRFDDLSRWVFDPVQMCIYSGLCTAPEANVDVSGAASFYGTNYFVQTPRAYKVLNAPFVSQDPTGAAPEAVDSSVFFTRGLKNRDFPTPWYSMCLMHQRREAEPADSSSIFASFTDRRVFKVSPWKVQPERGCGSSFSEGGNCGYIPDEEALISAADTLLNTVTPLMAIDDASGLRSATDATATLYASNPGTEVRAFGDPLTNTDDWREAGLWSKAPAYGDARALVSAVVAPAAAPWNEAFLVPDTPSGNFWTPFSWVLTQYKQRNLMVFQLRDPVYRAELAGRSECAGQGFAASGSNNARAGGKCINPRREAMCGKNVYRLGVEQCCNAERSLVRRINFEVFTEGNNAPRRESGCPCIKDNRRGHFRWWVIDQSIDCPAGESCCSGNQNSDDDTGRSIDVDSDKIEVGRCHNSATSKCCDTGCIYNPAAEQCCAIGQSYGISRDMAQTMLLGLEGLGANPTINRQQAGTDALGLAGAGEDSTYAGMSDLVLALYRILSLPGAPVGAFVDQDLDGRTAAAGLFNAILSSPRLTGNPGIQSIDEPCFCEDDTDCTATPTSVCCFGANPWGGQLTSEPIPFLPQPYAHIPQCSRYHQYPLNFDSNFGFTATQRADFDFQDGLNLQGRQFAAGTGPYTANSFSGRRGQLPTPPVADPRRVENLKNFKQALLPLTCRGKCIDSRYQMCCQGQVCAVEYQSCCNSTCCNRFSETCVTRRKSLAANEAPGSFSSSTVGSSAAEALAALGLGSVSGFLSDYDPQIQTTAFLNVFTGDSNANSVFEQYDVCTEVEALDVLKAFYVFVLPTLMLIFSFAGFAITIVYANRITGRNFKSIERVLVLIGTALVLLAMPLYFSPQYKYGAIATLLGLLTIFVASSRIRTAHGILVLVYLFAVLYFVDPFAGNQILSLNSERFFNEYNVGFVQNVDRGVFPIGALATNSFRNNKHGSGLMASLTANFPTEWQFSLATGVSGTATSCADGFEFFRLPRVYTAPVDPARPVRQGSVFDPASGSTTSAWRASVSSGLENWLWPAVPDTFLTTKTFGNGAIGNTNFVPEPPQVIDESTPGLCVQKRCTEFYLGFFQRDTKRAYDFTRVDNMHETRFGFCSRGWITALLVFGGLIVLLVLLGLVASVFALLPQERPTEGIDLVLKDAFPVAADYGGNERFNE